MNKISPIAKSAIFCAFFFFALLLSSCPSINTSFKDNENDKPLQPGTGNGETGKEVIFDDMTKNNWIFDKWDTTGTIQNSTKTEGTSAYHIECGAWGAGTFDSRKSDWTEIYYKYQNIYKKLVFSFNAGAVVDNENNLTISADNTGSVDLKDYIDGNIQPDRWYTVTIPLELISQNKQPVFRIAFFNNSDAISDFYIDNVYLEYVTDGTPPVISNVNIEIPLSNNGAVITWLTDEYADFSLEYGQDVNYSNGTITSKSLEDSLGGSYKEYVINASVPITNLSQATGYFFRITASDFQNDPLKKNKTVYTGTFSTRDEDKTAPVISGINVSNIFANKVEIKWTTDEISTSTVNYGINNTAASHSDDTLTKDHSLIIYGLNGLTTYTFNVSSSDYFGNNAVSADSTFTTTAVYSYDMLFSIDAGNTTNISPYIYGINYFGSDTWAKTNFTIGRLGGNRWSAYNWENNASNAGSDWYFQNDGYLSSSDQEGIAVTDPVTDMLSRPNAVSLITLPMFDYVAADKNGGGDIRNTPDYINTRLKISRAKKGSAFALTPDKTDAYVYQDEFINFLKNKYTTLNKIFIDLDNEPDLWSSTHEEIHPIPVGYDELCEKSIEYAKAIKDVAPEAKVFGFVSYGFNGFINLQDAPDSGSKGEFIDYFLERMKNAEVADGRRLVDVLDLHWYSEANVGGVRINDEAATGEQFYEERMQAPRTLWDTSYHENSWIDDWCSYSWNGNISLIPHIKQKINNKYSGTKIAFSEYNYGGGSDISGAIAQADALGIFGREGLFEASNWLMNENNNFIFGAFKAYLDYDGNGSKFGNTGLKSSTSDINLSSVYASSTNSGKMIIIAINKARTSKETHMVISNGSTYKTAKVYTIESGNYNPQYKSEITGISGNDFSYVMPKLSISILELNQ